MSAISQILPLVNNKQTRPGVIKIVGTNIFIPVTQTVGGGTGSKITVMVGTPVAAPVWTQTDFMTTGVGVFLVSRQSTAILVDGTTVIAVWINNPDPTTLGRSVFLDPAWDVAGLFYDLIANPPNATVITDQFIAALSVGKIGSQGAIIVTADASDTGAVGYLLFQGAAPAPPVNPILSPLQLVIFPFPVSFDCCCPEDVACVKPSGDGNMYAFSKGPLRIKK